MTWLSQQHTLASITGTCDWEDAHFFGEPANLGFADVQFRGIQMNAARVLVDGAWRECIWMYPMRRLPAPSALHAVEADDSSTGATSAMVGGLPLCEGSNYRYTVSSNGMLYTVTVDMAFDGGNNLCKVVSVLASEDHED